MGLTSVEHTAIGAAAGWVEVTVMQASCNRRLLSACPGMLVPACK